MKNRSINITSIKELLSQGMQREKVISICDSLYDMTDFICEDYPKHKTWFYKKHLPETLQANSGRDILYASDTDGKILGTSFIKDDEVEKKICTLFVSPDARGLGVGTALVEKSMEILDTTKPMITIADYKLPMFEKLISKYDWKQTQIVEGLYNEKSKELVYNGYLEQ